MFGGSDLQVITVDHHALVFPASFCKSFFSESANLIETAGPHFPVSYPSSWHSWPSIAQPQFPFLATPHLLFLSSPGLGTTHSLWFYLTILQAFLCPRLGTCSSCLCCPLSWGPVFTRLNLPYFLEYILPWAPHSLSVMPGRSLGFCGP